MKNKDNFAKIGSNNLKICL